MKKSLRNFARVVVDSLHDKTAKEAAAGMKEVVGYLKTKGLMSRWRDLERELHLAWKEKFGVSKVTITTAHALPARAYKILEGLAPGAEFVERVDDRLMGGAIIRLDDRRIDGSIIGSLQRLKNTLLQ